MSAPNDNRSTEPSFIVLPISNLQHERTRTITRNENEEVGGGQLAASAIHCLVVKDCFTLSLPVPDLYTCKVCPFQEWQTGLWPHPVSEGVVKNPEVSEEFWADSSAETAKKR